MFKDMVIPDENSLVELLAGDVRNEDACVTGRYIDKIHLTCHIGGAEFNHMKEKFKTLSAIMWYDDTKKPMVRIKHNDYPDIKQVKCVAGEAKREKYQDGFRIKVAGSGCMRVYFKSYRDKKSKKKVYVASIRLNPSALSFASMMKIQGFLFHVVGQGILDALKSAKVTRLDVAVDVANVKVDDFYFLHQTKRKMGNFISQYGETETVYLGERDNGMCIYNKAVEIREKPFKEDSYEDGEQGRRTRSKMPLTRFEVRMKPNIAFEELLTKTYLGDFGKLECYRVSGLVSLEPDFLDAAKLKGLKHVMDRKDPATKKLLKEVLDRAKVDLGITEDGAVNCEDALALLALIGPKWELAEEPLKTRYKGAQRRYVHEGLITQNLIKLARVKGQQWAKEQRRILGIKKSDATLDSALIGMPITKVDALRLIACRKAVVVRKES